MQSGYGSVSEIQQFMMENCGSSIFSIASATPPNPSVPTGPADIHAVTSQPLRYRPLHHHHHQQQQPQTPPPLPPHFSHFHSIPITQQLFQQSHQFQLFHPQPQEQRRLIPQHQLGLDQESGPENSTGGGGGGPSFLAATMNFKLAVNESSGGGSREGLNDEDSILQGDDGSESRLHHHWQREEESAIKEPSWRPLDIDYVNRNNKRYKEKEPETPTNKYCKKSKEGAEPDPGGHINGGSNYKLFSELEAIYKPGGSIISGGGGANRAGSGSALTGDETNLMPAATNPPGLAADHDLVGGSETSAGEEVPVKKFSKGSSGRRKRKRRQQKQLSSITAFFENLVKQLMDHQEILHRKFLEVMERRDQERTVREESWRRQEAAKSSREAAARAQERALASSREATIISFLEKITGETLCLPEKPQFPEEPAETTENLPVEPSNTVNNNGDGNIDKVLFNTSRWPKAEVHALIRVRSGLESRFQEPGLKGPLWEEVSSTMAALGYHRSAKRCKEKWENINKYFRKTKESGKKRPQHSKTCPYYQQLDQLYSKSLNKSQPTSSSSPNANVASATTSGTATDQGKDHSELLDAIIVSTDQQGFKFPEMSSLQFDFNGKDKDNNKLHHKVGNNGEEDEDDDDEEGGGREKPEEREEGEGESQVQPHQEEHHQHDSNLFFHCLQS
ncbi:trihelix transcription factor GT-2 [Cocos nucifera]|uniref:Trihelix transcription factor GT-2 n=1 Tax=Cocos nucifera TaxID=13894 RepID=A0A8K0IJ93_COCNU|nr:trihelix transcription factor GT-2 [Cocos nucifera]